VAIQVRFHRLATKEVQEAEEWYAARSPEAASRYRDAVLDAAASTARDRATHSIGRSKFRYVKVVGFPYRLIYFFDAKSSALVVAVMHDRRRPGYCRRRK
jgi:plasmid stabilization system protein ParE